MLQVRGHFIRCESIADSGHQGRRIIVHASNSVSSTFGNIQVRGCNIDRGPRGIVLL